MVELINAIKGFSINNAIEVGALVACALVIIIKNLNSFFATNIELMIASKDETRRRDICAGFFLLIIFMFANVILSYDETFIVVEVVIFIITILVIVITRLISFIIKKDFSNFIKIWEILCVITVMQLIVDTISYRNDINILSSSIIVSLFETVILILMFDGFRTEKSKIIIRNKKEKYYFFRKIDEDYLLCGDKNTISDVENVKIIRKKDIIDGKYHVEIEKDKQKIENIYDNIK